MRFAVIHSYYRSAVPSGENSVVDAQVELLRSAGHEVDLISRSSDDIGPGVAGTLRAGVSVARGKGYDPGPALRASEPDVILCHNLFPNIGYDWLAEWGSRTIATVHNFRPVCASGTLFRDGSECRECLDAGSRRAIVHRCYRDSRAATVPLAIASRAGGSHNRLLASARKVVTLNDWAYSVYLPVVGRERLVVLPNFVRTPDRASSEEAGAWVVAGRLSPEKGVLELLRCWPEGRALVVAGDGPLRGEVEAICRRRSSDLQYVGVLDRPGIMELLAGAVGLIVPSLCAEGLPTIVLEAFSIGCPVVVSSNVASARSLSAGGGAEMFEDFDQGLAGALSVVEEGHARYSRAALTQYESAYHPSVWLDGMLSLAREVANG